MTSTDLFEKKDKVMSKESDDLTPTITHDEGTVISGNADELEGRLGNRQIQLIVIGASSVLNANLIIDFSS